MVTRYALCDLESFYVYINKSATPAAMISQPLFSRSTVSSSICMFTCVQLIRNYIHMNGIIFNMNMHIFIGVMFWPLTFDKKNNKTLNSCISANVTPNCEKMMKILFKLFLCLCFE